MSGTKAKFYLLSSGHRLLSLLPQRVSPDGHNVFFGTHSRLVPADTDTKGDLYDARVCTAIRTLHQAPAGQGRPLRRRRLPHPVPPPTTKPPAPSPSTAPATSTKNRPSRPAPRARS